MNTLSLTQKILLHLYEQAPDDKVGLTALCQAVGESSKDAVLEELDRLESKQAIQQQGIDREHILCWITYTGRQYVKQFRTQAASENVTQQSGGSKRPQLPVDVQDEILDFLTTIPAIYGVGSLEAFVNRAGLDDDLKHQIPFGASTGEFFNLLVQRAWSYGTLRDGRDALESLLEAAKRSVGGDRRRECDRLIKKLQAL